MNLKDYIRIVPDFPQPGISFKDITTLLKDGAAYRESIHRLKDLVQEWKIDKIAGPEARGIKYSMLRIPSYPKSTVVA